MNRRTLLKSATLAAAMAAVSTSQTSLGATRSPKRIIVIGAGIAGLAAPVGNRLFFAGEATHKNRFATVHGALLSGRRAATQAHA